MRSLLKKWWVWPIILVVLVVVLLTVFMNSSDNETTLDDFTAYAQDGQVTTIRVSHNERDIEYELRGVDGTFETTKERQVPLNELLTEAGVSDDQISDIDIYYGESSGSEWIGLLINFLPMIIILGIIVLIMRRATKRAKGVELPYDPVCKVGVDAQRSAGSSTFQLVTYHFCSREHKAEFDQNPAKYLLIDGPSARPERGTTLSVPFVAAQHPS
jgi:YHS domain-containing protein